MGVFPLVSTNFENGESDSGFGQALEFAILVSASLPGCLLPLHVLLLVFLKLKPKGFRGLLLIHPQQAPSSFIYI